MAAIEDRAVELIDDFENRQVTGKNGGQRGVFASDPIKQRPEIQPGRAVRVPCGACKIDNDFGLARPGMRAFRDDFQFVGAAAPAFAQYQAFKFE